MFYFWVTRLTKIQSKSRAKPKEGVNLAVSDGPGLPIIIILVK